MKVDEITKRLEERFPDARVSVVDLTGGGDHFEASIVSTSFQGVSRVMRHRMVYELFTEELKGPIHALTLQTSTPEEL